MRIDLRELHQGDPRPGLPSGPGSIDRDPADDLRVVA